MKVAVVAILSALAADTVASTPVRLPLHREVYVSVEPRHNETIIPESAAVPIAYLAVYNRSKTTAAYALFDMASARGSLLPDRHLKPGECRTHRPARGVTLRGGKSGWLASVCFYEQGA